MLKASPLHLPKPRLTNKRFLPVGRQATKPACSLPSTVQPFNASTNKHPQMAPSLQRFNASTILDGSRLPCFTPFNSFTTFTLQACARQRFNTSTIQHLNKLRRRWAICNVVMTPFCFLPSSARCHHCLDDLLHDFSADFVFQDHLFGAVRHFFLFDQPVCGVVFFRADFSHFLRSPPPQW